MHINGRRGREKEREGERGRERESERERGVVGLAAVNEVVNVALCAGRGRCSSSAFDRLELAAKPDSTHFHFSPSKKVFDIMTFFLQNYLYDSALKCLPEPRELYIRGHP